MALSPTSSIDSAAYFQADNPAGNNSLAETSAPLAAAETVATATDAGADAAANANGSDAAFEAQALASSVISNGFSLNRATGAYRLLQSSQIIDSSVSALSTADISAFNENTAETVFASASASAAAANPFANFSAAALTDGLRDVFSQSFGFDNSFLDLFADTTEWLGGADANLYQGLLLILQMLSEDSPDAARQMLESLNGLRSMFGNSAGSAEAGTAMFNVAASFTAAFSQSIFSSENGGATGNQISITIRVDGEIVVMQANEATATGDPLVLDLGGDGIELTSYQDGAVFDLAGNGENVQTAFVQGDDALLFADLDGNGVLTDGKELFGDQEAFANGFDELASHDFNRDHVIDLLDGVFGSLRLYQDLNGDGKRTANETSTLAEAGVAAIKLNYAETNRQDSKGNVIAQTASFVRDDGSEGIAADALLRYKANR